MSATSAKEPSLSICDLLELIRRKPGFYIVESSVFRLDSFLGGYELALIQAGFVLRDANDLTQFREWLAPRLGFTQSTSGVANMIRDRSISDQDAFERFFILWDEFKKVSR
jgi:hypothetical protein